MFNEDRGNPLSALMVRPKPLWNVGCFDLSFLGYLSLVLNLDVGVRWWGCEFGGREVVLFSEQLTEE